MATWTRKLGLVVPSWNTVIEYEVWRLMPPGVSIHTARIPHTEDSERAFEAMIEQAPAAVDTLVHADLDAICYACTGGSFFRGAAFDEQLGRDLTEHAQRPVVTMARAIVDAARDLGLRRVAVAAPYEQWLLDRLVNYLEASDFEVLNAYGLGQQANVAHTPDDALQLAENGWHPDADGIIISCGNFPTLEVIDTIEKRLGKPVITSNQASVWSLLTSVGVPPRVAGAGQLLGDRTPADSESAR